MSVSGCLPNVISQRLIIAESTTSMLCMCVKAKQRLRKGGKLLSFTEEETTPLQLI